MALLEISPSQMLSIGGSTVELSGHAEAKGA
jgi:hypothetical protein